MGHKFSILFVLIFCGIFGCTSTEQKDDPSSEEELSMKKPGIPLQKLTDSFILSPHFTFDTFPYQIPDTALIGDDYIKDSVMMAAAFQHSVNLMGTYYLQGNVQKYLSLVLPSIIEIQTKKAGGFNQVVAKYEKNIQNDIQQIAKIISGPPILLDEIINDKNISAGWYAIIPTRRILKNGTLEKGWLAAVTYNQGKEIYFIDYTAISDKDVFFLMPDLEYLLDELPR